MSIQEIKELNAYQLAYLAGVSSPDSRDSQGAEFLLNVGASVVEAIEYARANGESFEPDDVASEVADSAIPIYTHALWTTFVDLCAYQVDISDFTETVDVNDLETLPRSALFAVGRTLAHALIERATEEEE